MKRFDPLHATAINGATDVLARMDFATLQSPQAADRLVASWALPAETARDLVAAERRRRSA